MWRANSFCIFTRHVKQLSKREKYNKLLTFNTSCENSYSQYLHYSLQP